MKRSGREEIAAVKKAKHVYQVICALVLLFPLDASLLSVLLTSNTESSYLVPRLLRQMRGESGGTHSMEEPHFRHLLGFC
ncbi:hypothetical protein ACFX10_038639 [Malus domestica]